MKYSIVPHMWIAPRTFKVTAPLKEALVGELNAETLTRAFGIAARALLAETRAVDANLCTRLEETVCSLVRTATMGK